ncbi:MAG: class I SAM-dependent methyltransferase [Candidatus Gracilibacteria bacterium]|nr:class I SAM-dependent methyltransferase [Candidatus Gracilibacteria bacterium]
MLNKLIQLFKKSAFIPNLFSLLHHSYIIRKGIYKGIINNSSYIYGKVLDFGCGEKPYKSILNFDEYVGVDFKSSGHDNSQNEVDFFWDGKILPFENDTFDSIISTEVFEHIFNIDEVLLELNRVLKKGGKIVITIPFVIHEHESPYDYARYTHFGLSSLLENHGFSVLKNEQYGSYFDTILQLNIWFLGKITETNNKYITLLLRIIFAAPLMIIINLISLFSPRMQSGLYLSNVIVGEKI